MLNRRLITIHWCHQPNPLLIKLKALYKTQSNTTWHQHYLWPFHIETKHTLADVERIVNIHVVDQTIQDFCRRRSQTSTQFSFEMKVVHKNDDLSFLIDIKIKFAIQQIGILKVTLVSTQFK